MNGIRLYKFDEAADKYYAGDKETLRHAILLGVVRARVEVCEIGQWVWWECDTDDTPQSGSSEHARWKHLDHASFELTGWFYLGYRAASKLAHGSNLTCFLVSESEDEEWIGGLTFVVKKSITLSDLWFEPSLDAPGRFRQPEDEFLESMADRVSELTNDSMIIAKYEAAALAGGGRMDIDHIQRFVDDFKNMEAAALIMATRKSVHEEYRQQRARGGKNKAANDPKVRAMSEIKIEWLRQHRPGGAFARDMAIKYQREGLDISEGGIKNAIGRWRKDPS